MKKIFSLIILTVVLASCSGKTEEKNQTVSSWTNISVSWSWVSIETKKWNVKISENGISIANLQIWWNVSELSDEDKSQFWELWQKTLETWSCEVQYNELIKTFWNDYSSCFTKRRQNTTCENNTEKAKVNVVVIFDASGSMKAKIWNEAMIDIAKDEVKKYISSLPKDISGSVFVYGHKWNSTNAQKNNSCSWIENFWDFTDKNSLTSKISSVPASGWTPIDKSLQEAEKYLKSISKNENDQNIILLVSDWKETCDWNPVETAKKIATNKNFYIDVIGFNVYWDTQSQLSEIAQNGGWKYTNVRSRADFVKVFSDMQAFKNEITCGASQASIDLRNAIDSINTFFTCDYLVHEEQVKVLTNMTQNCSSEVEKLLEKRSDEIRKKLEWLKTKAENDLEIFENNIENVMKKF